MARIEQSIEVGVPIHVAYKQLTQFNDYPRFMDEVDTVRQLDDTHLHWTATMAGRSMEWDAEITEQEQDRCIAWRNAGGPANAGKVEVQAAGPQTARVTYTLEFAPESMSASNAGKREQQIRQLLQQDLARLKALVEAQGKGTAATAGYAAGSEGFAGDEEPAAPVASAMRTAAEQRDDAAGPVRQHTGIDTHERGEFPADRPLDALKTDHALVRQLFDRYFQAQDAEEKKDTGARVLLLVEMHTSLEETVFYPRVRDADPALVARCEQEHEQAGQLIRSLRRMDETDPQAMQLFRQLADAIYSHVDTEERQLFPKVLQAGLDLGAIGQEMRDFETRMIAARVQKPAAPGLRQ